MADPHKTMRLVSFALTDNDKSFLDSMWMEIEAGGSIVIGIMKSNGDAYAFSRIAPEDFFAAVEILRPREPG